MKFGWICCAFVLIFSDIATCEADVTPAERKRILRLSPLPPPPADASNRFADDPGAIALGRKLFFETRLSAGGDMACVSCHKPELGWADGKAVATGEVKFPRNVPSIWNTAYNRWFFWDGRADSAWSQALGPIENRHEMAFNRMQLVHFIRRDKVLKKQYEAVFGLLYPLFGDSARFPARARPDYDNLQDPLHLAWVKISTEDRTRVNGVFANLGKAIAAFERTLITPESPFDRYVDDLRTGKKSRALSASQQRGLTFFIGRGKCTFCHSGPNFSDGEFHDLGLAVAGDLRVDPGRYGAVRTLLNDPFNRKGAYVSASDPAAPVNFLTLQGQQLAQFKTPTLRQLAYTAPYMHDGRFNTLHDVVEFYSVRKNARPLKHAGSLIQPLNMTEREVNDMVAFLESLSTPDKQFFLPQSP